MKYLSRCRILKHGIAHARVLYIKYATLVRVSIILEKDESVTGVDAEAAFVVGCIFLAFLKGYRLSIENCHVFRLKASLHLCCCLRDLE